MLKKILLPVVAAATFALVAPSAADASPLNPVKSPAVYGGRVHIGVGVGIPIGGRRVRRARTVHSGYWTTVYERRIERLQAIMKQPYDHMLTPDDWDKKVKAAYDSQPSGNISLNSIYKACNGSVSYDDIKLAIAFL